MLERFTIGVRFNYFLEKNKSETLGEIRFPIFDLRILFEMGSNK